MGMCYISNSSARISSGYRSVWPAPVKKRRVVRVAELSTAIYLETQQDVDAFVEKLRQKREAAIAADERVEIR